MVKKFLFIILLTITAILIVDLATDGFSLSHISVRDLPDFFENQGQIPSTILSQRYTYLGKGAQSYVFESEDGKYVLKFFKFKHLKTFWRNTSAKHKAKIEKTFRSHVLSFQTIPEESGLIYVQLHPREDLDLKTTFIDKAGREFLIPLGSYCFVLQKKGRSLEEVMSSLIENDKWNEVEELLAHAFALFYQEWDKGVYDRDQHVLRNFGLLEEKLLHLDVGMMGDVKTLEEQTLQLKKIHLYLQGWFEQHYPDKKAKWEKLSLIFTCGEN